MSWGWRLRTDTSSFRRALLSLRCSISCCRSTSSSPRSRSKRPAHVLWLLSRGGPDWSGLCAVLGSPAGLTCPLQQAERCLCWTSIWRSCSKGPVKGWVSAASQYFTWQYTTSLQWVKTITKRTSRFKKTPASIMIYEFFNYSDSNWLIWHFIHKNVKRFLQLYISQF